LRFPIAALFLVIAGFMFLAFFGVGSLLLTETADALDPLDDDLDIGYHDIITKLPTAFGIIGAILLVLAVVVFIVDSLSDEPEMYWRR